MLWTLLFLGLVVVLLAAVYAWQARTAYLHLTAAQERIPVLREQVVGGDPAAGRTAERFADHTGAARDALAGPHWSLLGALPWVGPNVDAVRTVTRTADDLATQALPDLMRAVDVLDPAKLAPRNGRVRLGPVREAAPHVVAAQTEVASAAERLERIDTAELHQRLQAPVDQLSTTLADLRGQTATAAKVARLLPSMLGAEGPRHYLVLAQNPAEPRALGGIPGAVILLRADRGRIELVEHRTAASFGNTGVPVLRLTRAERTLYGTQLGRYMQNVTDTPDFPRAARLARAMWRQGTGRQVDGVVTVDPYTLQLLLGATGPVTLPSGHRLTGENAAQLLLNEVYKQITDPAAQDAFFAVAAATVFDKVVSGTGDLPATGTALAEAVRQGRIMVWSAHEQEQAVIETTAASGELRGEHEGSPVVGVYLHDRTTAKIAYYERMAVEVTPTSCEADDGRSLTVDVQLSSEVPRDVRRLPDYLTGGGNQVPVGHMRTDVLLYAPSGARITEVRSSEDTPRVTSYVHEELFVARQTVDLAPRQSVTLSYDLALPSAPRGPVKVRTTPGPAQGWYTAATTQCEN